jgi:hypothetical protein
VIKTSVYYRSLIRESLRTIRILKVPGRTVYAYNFKHSVPG